MAIRRPLGPDLDIGCRVHHRTDLAKSSGVVVGLLFRPRQRALVRWQYSSATFEVLEDLEEDPIGVSVGVSVTEQIRQRIERGILPVTIPMKTASLGLAPWQPCDGCDELIGPMHVAYAFEYSAPPRIVRLHRACYRLWVAECQRWEAQRSKPLRKPLARLVPEPAAELICLACARPIEPAQSLVKDGANLLHAGCFVDRPHPIAGGGPLAAWPLIGDQHIGRRLGTTRDGHQEFLAACADVRWASAATVIRARRVVADTRALRRRSA